MTTSTDTATLKQVGRDCLQAYTGLANPEHLCAMAEILFSVSDLLGAAEGDEFEGGGRRSLTSIESYLPFVCCSIREDGWLSRGQALKMDRPGQATADIALFRGVYAKPQDKNPLRPEEEDYNLANAVIGFCEEFFAEKDVATLSDYENSLRVAMGSGIVHPKFTGIIASAVQFYNKDLERRQFAESKSKAFANSQYQGQVGDRLVFENVKVVSYRTWEGQFGVTHFYTFNADGNCLTYFASRDMKLVIGQTVSVKGSVKKHEMYQPKYKGEAQGNAYRQTVLTRCALVTRAKVVSSEVVAKEEKKGYYVDAKGEKFGYFVPESKWVDESKVVKYHHYHLVAIDGRKFVLVSKSAKKVLVPGYEAIVEYAVEDLSGLNDGERPCSLVK